MDSRKMKGQQLEPSAAFQAENVLSVHGLIDWHGWFKRSRVVIRGLRKQELSVTRHNQTSPPLSRSPHSMRGPGAATQGEFQGGTLVKPRMRGLDRGQPLAIKSKSG